MMHELDEESSRPVIHVGVDIGQVVDKSTIAVARLTSKDVGNTRTVWQWAKTRTMTAAPDIEAGRSPRPGNVL